MPDSTLASPSPGAKASSPRIRIADPPGLRATRGYICAMVRPTIMVTSSPASIDAVGRVPTKRPSRSTVTRSEIAITSSILWLM